MYEIKLYKLKLKAFYLLLGSSGFVLMFLFLIDFSITLSLDSSFVIFSILFFGLGIPISLYQILDYRPQMIITKNGIWERTSLKEELKWSQIREINPIEMYNQTFLSILTDKTYVTIKKKSNLLSKFNKMFGFHDQNVNIGNLNVNNVELLRFLYQLVDANDKQRQDLILKFNPKEVKINKKIVFLQILKYILISFLLLTLTLFSYTFFGL